MLGDPVARLACFDALSKETETIATAATPAQSLEQRSVAASPAVVQPEASAELTPAQVPMSRMVHSWELDKGAQRGVFSFRPHRDTYLLAANYSTTTNDNPFREFTPGGIKSKHVELTYQLSFKLKLLEGIGDTPIDLWGGYTQRSFWQAYNRSASSPFRETNYEPEVMAVLPLNKAVAGVNIRYAGLGAVHQSNGQSGTLSRSWNRLYAEVGADKGDFSVTARIWKRLDNAKSDNDNADINDFLGHGDVRATYRDDGHEYSLLVRRNFHTNHGAVQAGWAFPLTANLKGYTQVFVGYGQSLIDYNYSQKSVGIGAMMDF